MWDILILLAEGEQPQGGPGGLMMWAPLVLLFVMMYFILIRPRQQEKQQWQRMLQSLKKNEKVVTSGGLIGTVVAVSETEDELTLKVDENVRVKVLKSSVIRNLTQEEALKEQQAKK